MKKSPLDPRKRPVQARARASWDAIVEAAAQILAEGGLTAFNTNAVAERAGVSVGTLYQYFPGKDALMVVLIEREQRARLVALSDVVERMARSSLDESLAALVDAAIGRDTASLRLARSLDHEEARLPVAAILERATKALDDCFAMLLARHFQHLPRRDLLAMARTGRAIARAVLDEHVDTDQKLARAECLAALKGYLDKRGRGD